MTIKTIPTIKTVRLSFWLPWGVIIAGVALLIILLIMQVRSYQRNVNDYVQHSAYEELLRTQRLLEVTIKRGEQSNVDHIINDLKINHAIIRAALLDNGGKVLSATIASWKHQPITQVLPSFPYVSMLDSQSDHSEQLTLDDSNRILYTVIPVTLESNTQQQGLLYIEYDLTPLLSRSIQVINAQTAVFFIVLLLTSLLFLYFARQQILKPVNILKRGMQNIAEDKFDSQIAFDGDGEFSILSKELNRMAYQLEIRSIALKASEARFRQLAEASQEAIIFHDNGIIVDANSKVESLVGLTASNLIGKHLLDFVAPYHHEVTKTRMVQLSRGVWNVDVQNIKGEIIPTEVSVSEQMVDGHLLRVVAMHDISRRLAAEEEIRRLSSYDPLTGLANRHFLIERVAMEQKGVQKSQQISALATLNINGFKTVNDSLGMAVGDKVLRLVAKRLSSQLAQGQILARVEGDTFAVLMTHLGDNLESASAEAARIVEHLLTVINEDMQVDEHNLHLQAGAGVVMITDESQEPAELLREAETAMHQAKVAEDNRVHFFAHALQQAASERLAMRNELRGALLSSDQIVLHYQPQLTRSGKVYGVEALVRWQHPKRGLIYPGAFIEAAEKNGLIVPLGNKIMQQAAQALKHWHADIQHSAFHEPCTMAVNVSPRQFRETDFITRIEDILAEVGIDAMHFELELTESVVANDLELTVHKMQQLRKHGVRFALDDFGTGYSSLSYLKYLPIDILKIDRSFVMDIDASAHPENGKRPAVLIDAIVAMAHQMNMRVLAEGVETLAQLNYLKAAGCDVYQGYHFSKPLAEADLLKWAEVELPQFRQDS